MSDLRKPNVVIDHQACIASKGCRACIDACPLDILSFDDKQGVIRQVHDECWYCLPCENDYPTKAVRVEIPYQVR
jgi:NAD-dependent dihydropyrimidine dehydrogenase PreA subunit